jgi:uncharacterized protein HemX
METQENQNPPVMNYPQVQKTSSTGPIIGIIIIIVILVLGGLYFWGQKLSNNSADEQMMAEQDAIAESQSISQTMELKTQGTSDDLSSIEADLNATDLDSLGNELDTAESGI